MNPSQILVDNVVHTLVERQPIKQQESRLEVLVLSHTVQFYPLCIQKNVELSFSKRKRYERLSMAMESWKHEACRQQVSFLVIRNKGKYASVSPDLCHRAKMLA